MNNTPETLPMCHYMKVALGAMGIAPDVFWKMDLKEFICAYEGWCEAKGISNSPNMNRDSYHDLLRKHGRTAKSIACSNIYSHST